MFQVSSFKFQEKGAASLLTILAVASLTLVIGISLASTGFIETAATGGQVKTDETFIAAQAGAKDAMMRLSRDKNFTSVGGYSLSVGSASVIITVEQIQPSSCSGGIGAGQACMVSIASFDNKTRRVEIILNIDSGGKITRQSWKEN